MYQAWNILQDPEKLLKYTQMSNPDKSITTEAALEVCRQVYPNLSWEAAIIFQPRFNHGKIYATMEHCWQYLDLTLLIGNGAIISLNLGEPHKYSSQVVIHRGEPCQLGEQDPGADLESYLKSFQRRLMTKARLNLIFSSAKKMPHSIDENLNVVMWQCEIDEEEGGMK